jgi:hypothetical protein
MMWRSLWANRAGRGNLNPELSERFGRLQTRILSGLEAVGYTGAGNNTLAIFSSASGSTMLQVGAVVLDLGVAYTARRAKRIEKARQELAGARDPATTAAATNRLLSALGLDTAASGASTANPATYNEWLNNLESITDQLGL